MRSPSRLLISVTLACLPLLASPLKPALAETVLGPGEAAAHLARAHGAAGKCGLMSEPLRNELSDYVNMAEVAAASTVGPDEIVRLMNEGRQAGRAMACNEQTRGFVLSSLDAAREALAQAEGDGFIRGTVATAPAVQQDAQEPVEEQLAARVVEPAKPKPAPEPEQLQARGNDAELIRYAQATAAYYVERRCQHLGHDRATRFWQQVVSRHNAMLSRHDRAAVARAKARAISMAEASGRCGARTRQMVSTGISLVASN
jgi:hypothetical protein